jgi:hypothetical protein
MQYLVMSFYLGEWRLLGESQDRKEAAAMAKVAKQADSRRKVYVMETLYEQPLIG